MSEGACGDTVTEHLKHGPLPGEWRAGSNREQDKSHVTDTGIGDQSFEIMLTKGQDGTIKNSDDSDDGADEPVVRDRIGTERQRKADQAVSPGLEEQAGQNHRSGRWGFGMGVR